MSDGENFQTVVEPPENDAIVADSQAVTIPPLRLHRLDVSRSGCAKSSDRLQNAQGRGPVDRAKLRLSFRGERKRTPYSLPRILSTISS